jgi:hypothetical protein
VELGVATRDIPFEGGETSAMPGPANAIRAVVDAPPGFMSHNELGLMPLRGGIRP